MGVLRIKSYSSGRTLSNGLSYANNKDKTTYKEKEQDSFDREIANALSYSENIEKTVLETKEGEKILVSGHGCVPKDAALLFKQSRKIYLENGHKESTR